MKGSCETAEHEVSQSQGSKQKTDADQETVQSNLSDSHRSTKKNEEDWRD